MEPKNIKILIAPDSFKDCLSSEKVGNALEEGLRQAGRDFQITVFPVADGGEGTASCIAFHNGGTWKELIVSDPLGRPVNSKYLVLEDGTAVIELAEASGLELLKPRERDALKTSTYGTGQLIRHALENGVRKVILTLGGSATVDGGTGIAEAIGFRFIDKSGKIFSPAGGNLLRISNINHDNVHPLFGRTEVIIACDVSNILNGPMGAAKIFGPQKGASGEEIDVLERGLKHVSTLLLKDTGFRADDHPGTGAAGGAALFLLAYGRGKLQKGFEIVANLTGLAREIEECDFVITGEGRMDHQTSFGKVISSVSGMTIIQKKPLIAVTGAVKGERQALKTYFQMKDLYVIGDYAADLKDSISNAPEYLKKIGKIIAESELVKGLK